MRQAPQPRHSADRVVDGRGDLGRERVHVRRQPKIGQVRCIPLRRPKLRLRPVKQVDDHPQRPPEPRHGELEQADGHNEAASCAPDYPRTVTPA